MNCKIVKQDKFLFLPKKIHGKWYWLRTIIEVTTQQSHIVNGEVSNIVVKKEYYI